MKKTKKLIGTTLKEACKIAREEAIKRNATSYIPVRVYLEEDGSFTVEGTQTKNSKLYLAVDKAGVRYKKKWVRNEFGKHEKFVKI